MPLIFKTVSGTALLAILVLVGLQAIPWLGLILILFGAPFLAGILVYGFLIGVSLEAAFGRLPRALIAIPVATCVGYYAYYTDLTARIRQHAAELRQQNSGEVLNFDPALHSLVSPDAEALIKQYAFPVVYEANRNFPEGYLAYRLLRSDQCSRVVKDSRHRIATFGVHFGNKFLSVCELRYPEAPLKKIVTAVKRGDEEVWKRKNEIGERLTEIVVDGAVVGKFKTASVWLPGAIPFILAGCGLGGGTSGWGCGIDLIRSYTPLNTVPDDIDHARFLAPESVMLGITRYTEQDLTDYKGYAENEETLVRLAEEPKRVEDDSFAILKALVDGGDPQMPFGLGFSLATNPPRLGPFAEAMARRFFELAQQRSGSEQNRRAQIEALRTALAALPADSFAKVADQIFDFIQRNERRSSYPELYVRAADAGAGTQTFYQTEFLSGKFRGTDRFMPVLAICRIGQAAPNVIAEMKRQFTADQGHDDYRSELLVTLLKLGEDNFIRDSRATFPAGWMDWPDAVLAGAGRTDVGPNNCVGYQTKIHAGATMDPSLQFISRHWTIKSPA
jgi:hypothetical protein